MEEMIMYNQIFEPNINLEIPHVTMIGALSNDTSESEL